MVKKKSAAAVAKTMSAVKPCAKKKTDRVSIFSPWANRMVSVMPYSPRAKKIYKFYIEKMGYDTAWVAPNLNPCVNEVVMNNCAYCSFKYSIPSYYICGSKY